MEHLDAPPAPRRSIAIRLWTVGCLFAALIYAAFSTSLSSAPSSSEKAPVWGALPADTYLIPVCGRSTVSFHSWTKEYFVDSHQDRERLLVFPDVGAFCATMAYFRPLRSKRLLFPVWRQAPPMRELYF